MLEFAFYSKTMDEKIHSYRFQIENYSIVGNPPKKIDPSYIKMLTDHLKV